MTNIRAIEINHLGRALRGTRYGPIDATATVLVAHGFSDCRNGPGRLIVDFAHKLSEKGLAVLAFDRAGHGESDGDFFDVNVPDEIDQLAAMAHSVAGPLHLVGHSLGGMELATLAGKNPDKVASLTLWAPAAASADECARGVILGKPVSRIDVKHPFDVKGQALGPAFMNGFDHYSPFEGLSNYTGIVNIHHGEKDEVVRVEYSRHYAQIWPQAKLKLYPQADHGWSELHARRELMTESVRQIAEAASR